MKDNPESTEDSRATPRGPDGDMHPSPVRASGTRPPLFCVFPGPPGACDIANILSEDQPVYHFLFADLGRMSSFPTVEWLAASYIEGLRKVRAHGPYQLCGYSSGGFVAYEMARSLIEQGEDVSFLALFDTWHPKFTQELPLRELLRYRGMRFLDRLRKYRRVLSQGRFDEFAAGATEFVLKRVKVIGWRAIRFIFRSGNRPVPQAMQVVESIVSLQTYAPRTFAKRVILIRPADPVDMKLKDRTVGWHGCAAGGVDVHFVPALHGVMMDMPHVRHVVDKIAPYLADAPRSEG